MNRIHHKTLLKTLARKIKHMFSTGRGLAAGLHATVTFLASLVTILGALVLVINYQQFVQFYNQTFRTDYYWESTLNTLSPQMNLSIFKEKLGEPTFTNQLTKNPDYVEHVFVNKLFYVTAIVENNTKVESYAITTREKGFMPHIKRAGITLGKSTFAQLGDKPELTGGYKNQSRHWYEELYAQKAEGAYLTHAYATSNLTNAGNLKEEDIPTASWRDMEYAVRKNCDSTPAYIYENPLYRHKETGTDKLGTYFKLASRNQTVITSVGFISDHPKFYCAFDTQRSDPLPNFMPDYDQAQLLGGR